MREIILLFAWLSVYAPPLAQNLVAYYPSNGNTNDESGNNINLTNSGATLVNDRFENPNSAYYFDGTAKLYCSDNDLLDLTSNFSI